MKWNCIGVKERIEQIESFINNSRCSDKQYRAYRALKELDRNITILMEDEDNDTSYLLTYRRKVRTLLRKIA